MLEEQIQLNTADRQLLYDIRSESRKTNDHLTQLLEVLRPIAKDTVLKEVKKAKVKVTKEDKNNGDTLPISNGRTGGGDTTSGSPKHTDKRKTMHDKQPRSTTPVLSSNDDSNGGKRVSRASRANNTSKVHSKK